MVLWVFGWEKRPKLWKLTGNVAPRKMFSFMFRYCVTARSINQIKISKEFPFFSPPQFSINTKHTLWPQRANGSKKITVKLFLFFGKFSRNIKSYFLSSELFINLRNVTHLSQSWTKEKGKKRVRNASKKFNFSTPIAHCWCSFKGKVGRLCENEKGSKTSHKFIPKGIFIVGNFSFFTLV